jgi:hypothetical protein
MVISSFQEFQTEWRSENLSEIRLCWLGRDNEKYSIYGAYLEDEFIASSNNIISERISPQTGSLYQYSPTSLWNVIK